MYEPAKRLRTFVSSRESVASSPQKRPKPKPAKKSGSELFAHIVHYTEMREELRRTNLTMQELVDDLQVGQTYEMKATMKTGVMAERMCDKVGSGTSFAYVAILPSLLEPACLAVGKTTGCRVEGTTVIASWEIAKKTCQGGEDNPWTMAKLGKLRAAFFRAVKPSEPLFSVFS